MKHKIERKTIRFTPEELRVIEEKAVKSNLNISEFIRRSALSKNIIVIEDLKEFIKELRGIGKNLNQLAILSHQGKITIIDLESTQKKVDEIWQLLNLLMAEMKK